VEDRLTGLGYYPIGLGFYLMVLGEYYWEPYSGPHTQHCSGSASGLSETLTSSLGRKLQRPVKPFLPVDLWELEVPLVQHLMFRKMIASDKLANVAEKPREAIR